MPAQCLRGVSQGVSAATGNEARTSAPAPPSLPLCRQHGEWPTSSPLVTLAFLKTRETSIFEPPLTAKGTELGLKLLQKQQQMKVLEDSKHLPGFEQK